MSTLDRMRRDALRAANREARPMAILNLNRVGAAMYVVRFFEEAMRGERAFVEKVDPAFVVGARVALEPETVALGFEPHGVIEFVSPAETDKYGVRFSDGSIRRLNSAQIAGLAA